MSGKPRSAIVTTTSRERITGSVATPTVSTGTFAPGDRAIFVNIPTVSGAGLINNGYSITVANAVEGDRIFTIAPGAGGTRQMLPGLTNNVTYTCTMKVLGYDGADSAATNSVAITPRYLPPPVSNGDPQATTGQIVFNWLPPVAAIPIGYTISGYRIRYIGVNNNPNTAVTPTAPTVTSADYGVGGRSHTFSGLTNHVQYWFEIYALYGVDGTSEVNESVALVVNWSPMPVPVFVSSQRTMVNPDGYEFRSFTFGPRPAGIVGYGVGNNTIFTTATGNIIVTELGPYSVNTSYTVQGYSINQFNRSAGITISFTTAQLGLSYNIISTAGYLTDSRNTLILVLSVSPPASYDLTNNVTRGTYYLTVFNSTGLVLGDNISLLNNTISYSGGNVRAEFSVNKLMTTGVTYGVRVTYQEFASGVLQPVQQTPILYRSFSYSNR